MRIVGATEARIRLSSLLDAAANGQVITITKRGRPVARLVPPAPIDRARAERAVRNIRALRHEIGWSGSVDEILELRDAGRRGAAEPADAPFRR